MRRLLTLCLTLMLLLSLTTFAQASQIDPTAPTEVSEDGEIIYTDGVDKFVFITDSEYTDTDQFHNFKTVMPGDIIEQRISLRNDISNDRKIKVYMRSHGAHESSVDFLSQLNLTIVQNAETLLFDATADKAAQLSDWVYLGTLYSGGECELLVTLEVPVTLGNEYANCVGYLDWEFGVSEFPVEDTDPEPPKTGDDNRVWLYGGLMLGSLVMLILLLLGRRKKDEE